MTSMHAASPALCWLVLSSPMAAQVVVEGPPARGVRVEAQPVLRVDGAAELRKAGTKGFPGAGPAIDLGLAWLLAHQDEDGRWNADTFMAHDGANATDGAGVAVHDVGLTGLALFALAREGSPPADHRRRRALRRGAAWLAGQQQKNGLVGTMASHDFVYGHAIATLGLCATTAATGDAPPRNAAQNALNYLESHRNPFAVWRYQPRDNDNDSSVTTWATLANLAGAELGLQVNPQALTIADTWFQQVTDRNGRIGYTRAGERSARKPGDNAKRFPPERVETMTAAGLMCRHALGKTAEVEPALEQAQELLLDKPPVWTPEEGCVDHCYWFFATEALRFAGGETLETWGSKLVEALVKGQRVDGAFAGSWDPVDAWGDDGGRIYATAMSVLALQALYGAAGAPAKAAPK